MVGEKHAFRTTSAWPTKNKKIYTVYLMENLIKYRYLTKIKKENKKTEKCLISLQIILF